MDIKELSSKAVQLSHQKGIKLRQKGNSQL
jgi:hypothetical protein